MITAKVTKLTICYKNQVPYQKNLQPRDDIACVAVTKDR